MIINCLDYSYHLTFVLLMSGNLNQLRQLSRTKVKVGGNVSSLKWIVLCFHSPLPCYQMRQPLTISEHCNDFPMNLVSPRMSVLKGTHAHYL